MEYTKYSYLWPPRPSKAIPVELLSFYERRGWVGQVKKNGTCTVLFISPDKQVIAKTRHNDDHKRWSPTEKSTGIFKQLPDSWYVFVVEVLHSKTTTVKDTVYIFDILVADGQMLEGTTFSQRMDLLNKLFPKHQGETDSHYIITPNVWLAKILNNNFKQTMKKINYQKSDNQAPIDEGIVLKNPNAKLEMPFKQKSNGSWQVKCRIEHKSYSF